MSRSTAINYTPLAHLTDEEFVHALVTKQDPTDYETEAMLRLERLLDHLSAAETDNHDHLCEAVSPV